MSRAKGAEWGIIMQDNDKINRIQELILQGNIDEARQYCVRCAKEDMNDKDIIICFFLFHISEKEMEKKEACIFDVSGDLTVLSRHYHNIKFLVRRLEFAWVQADPMELVSYCLEYKVSPTALHFIIDTSTRNPRSVKIKVKQLFEEYTQRI